MELFDDDIVPDAVREVKQDARAFAEEHIAPNAAEYYASGEYPPTRFSKRGWTRTWSPRISARSGAVAGSPCTTCWPSLRSSTAPTPASR